MSKRRLKIQNEIIENNGDRVMTRSASKRANESTETKPEKKTKIDRENVDPKNENSKTRKPKNNQVNQINNEPSTSKGENDENLRLEQLVDGTKENRLNNELLATMGENEGNLLVQKQIDGEKENRPNNELPTPMDENDENLLTQKQVDPKQGISPNDEYLTLKDEYEENFLVSKTAMNWSKKFLEIVPHVDPDTYGLYIHNDFSAYGELEIVENSLLDLAKTLFLSQEAKKEKVDYYLAFRLLEGFNYLIEQTDSIATIDDGDRFYQIMRLIAAFYITILRGLLPQKLFQKNVKSDDGLIRKLKQIEENLPNFKQTLEQTMIIGQQFLRIADIFSSYTSIINIVYRNWVFYMENEKIDLNKKPAPAKQSLYSAMKQATEIERNGIETGGKESFDFLKGLTAYNRSYRMGGDTHDLRKWPKARRERYSLDQTDYFEQFWL